MREMAPLTVLVGANGSGKSTLLDALLVGAHPTPAESVGRVVRRRGDPRDGARWLFTRGAADAPARIVVRTAERAQATVIERVGSVDPMLAHNLRNQGHGEPYLQVRLEVSDDHDAQPSDGTRVHLIAFGYDGSYDALPSSRAALALVPFVRIHDPSWQFRNDAIARRFSELLERGHLDALVETLRAALPGTTGLQVGVDEADNAVPYIVSKRGAVPVGQSGDGSKLLVRIALNLASTRIGVVLLEEPEAHLHPGAARMLARMIVSTLDRGVQTVLTTHSLEFVDDLLAEATLAKRLNDLCVFRTALRDGRLLVSRIPGDAVERARNEIQDDLR